jgi:type I restriction enzyme M protein
MPASARRTALLTGATSPSSRPPSATTHTASAERADQGEDGRFRCFTREAISQRGDNLDISWLRDESNGDGEELPEPEVIAAEILGHLRRAVDEMEGLVDSLDQTEEDSAGIP